MVFKALWNLLSCIHFLLLLLSPTEEKPSANDYAVSGIEVINAKKEFSLIRLGNQCFTNQEIHSMENVERKHAQQKPTRPLFQKLYKVEQVFE